MVGDGGPQAYVGLVLIVVGILLVPALIVISLLLR
jgi:hypothetical protein